MGVDVGGTDVEVGTGVDVGGTDVGVDVGRGGLEVAVGASAAGVGTLLLHPTENKIHKTPNINCSDFWQLIFAPFVATLVPAYGAADEPREAVTRKHMILRKPIAPEWADSAKSYRIRDVEALDTPRCPVLYSLALSHKIEKSFTERAIRVI
jgi:hypothetical protein